MEIQMYLKFSEEEKRMLSSSFAFGDAEEQLSYAVNQLGSDRVATLIINANNTDIAILALTEVDGFSDNDKSRIQKIIK